MGGWGGYQRNNNNFQQQSHCVVPRSKSGKPPSGSWQPTVPSWEKKFCSSIGRMPWKKICETKFVMDLFENIVKWDDSAGENAFQNAKARYWAQIKGLPCDISLPDPDMYIDDVDYDAEIDPELLADLNRQIVSDEGLANKPTVLDLSFLNMPVICTGWGDDDDPVVEGGSGWGYGAGNPKIGSGAEISKNVNALTNKAPRRYRGKGRRGDGKENSKNVNGAKNKISPCCRGEDDWGDGAGNYKRKEVLVNNDNNTWNDGWGQGEGPSGNANNIGDPERGGAGDANSWESGWEDCNKIASNTWESCGEMGYKGQDGNAPSKKKYYERRGTQRSTTVTTSKWTPDGGGTGLGGGGLV